MGNPVNQESLPYNKAPYSDPAKGNGVSEERRSNESFEEAHIISEARTEQNLLRLISIMIKSFIFLLLTALLVTMTGCQRAVLESTKHSAVIDVKEPDTIGYYLPKGLINIKLEKQEKPNEDYYTLTLSAKFVPDYNHFYILKYHGNIFSSDNPVQVKLTENGLLKSIETKVKDESVEIVKKLMETITLEPPAKETVATLVSDKKVKELIFKEVFDVDIDPDDSKELEKVNGYLAKIKVTITITSLVKGSISNGSQHSQVGIYYRPCLPYLVTVKKEKETTEPKDEGFLRTAIFNLPNRSPILSVDVTRAAFVEKHTTLTFNDGVLEKYEMEKPSEMLAGLGIPYEIVKALVKLPTNLIQLRINSLAGTKTLVEDQIKQLEAQKNLKEALEKLKPSPAPPSPAPNRPGPKPSEMAVESQVNIDQRIKVNIEELEKVKKSLQELQERLKSKK